MEKLIDDIRSLLSDYFDKKVENVNWYYDLNAKLSVIEIVAGRLERIAEEVKCCDEDIDDYLEEFEERHSADAARERKAYFDDIRTQDYLEESLFN